MGSIFIRSISHIAFRVIITVIARNDQPPRPRAVFYLNTIAWPGRVPAPLLLFCRRCTLLRISPDLAIVAAFHDPNGACGFACLMDNVGLVITPQIMCQ